MLVPAYRIIERTARSYGFDPDRPPLATETFLRGITEIWQAKKTKSRVQVFQGIRTIARVSIHTYWRNRLRARAVLISVTATTADQNTKPATPKKNHVASVIGQTSRPHLRTLYRGVGSAEVLHQHV
jgi:hypothetical protein